MSGAAQWVVPVVLGLAAAGLTWMAPDDLRPTRDDGLAEVRSDAPYVLVPWTDHGATLLRYNATQTQHGLGGILDVHGGRFVNGTFWWDGHGWECHRPGAACTPDGAVAIALPAHGGGRATLPPGAVVSAENGTLELTFYIFTGSGHLLATNAPRSDWDHFDLHGQFTRFSDAVWHLGPGPAPDGARSLPMFRAEALALLTGTPVGGVQSGVLEAHPYDWLLGPVWVTARVESIV